MFSPVENVWSPAHQAIEDGNLDALACLLDAGVDPNEVCSGLTLLAHAVDYEADTAIQAGDEMRVTFTAVLFAYGASPQSINGSVDPLGLADSYGHAMAKRLIERFSTPAVDRDLHVWDAACRR
ncbi:ankyrin repeat domain-containing protein [Streptomyces sp. NPDC086787]|uniref:ankyrin repeat domain-containing protein n=1 Tax=Streptomyces sp. NPDC086787 TaxID=3365759 RepID=UPI003822E19B